MSIFIEWAECGWKSRHQGFSGGIDDRQAAAERL
jgi:hypothetical protein